MTNNYKFVLLGDSGVGKSSLVQRFVRNEFTSKTSPTIGAAFIRKKLYDADLDVHYQIEIWDTAGQERYDSLMPLYYRGANIAIIVFDICDIVSFLKAKKYLNDIRNKNPKCVCILVGNKSDLEPRRTVSSIDIINFANLNNVLSFEASAKENFNIKNIFMKGCRTYVKEVIVEKELVNINEEGEESENGNEKLNCINCY